VIFFNINSFTAPAIFVDVFLFFTLKKYLVSTFIGGARFIGRSTVARRSSEKIELTPVGSDTRERVQRVNRRDAGRGAAAHSAPRGGPDLEREGLRFGHLIRSRRLFAGSSTRRVYARGLRLLRGEVPGGWVTTALVSSVSDPKDVRFRRGEGSNRAYRWLPRPVAVERRATRPDARVPSRVENKARDVRPRPPEATRARVAIFSDRRNTPGRNILVFSRRGVSRSRPRRNARRAPTRPRARFSLRTIHRRTLTLFFVSRAQASRGARRAGLGPSADRLGRRGRG